MASQPGPRTRHDNRPDLRDPLNTRFGFVLGHHVGHSISPRLHNAAFRALNLPFVYELLDTPPSGLESAIDRMRRADSLGGNVTMPFKKAVLDYADEISAASRNCGAGNLLVNHEGLLALHNTDVHAILVQLTRRANEVGRGAAVILGAGGAAAAALEALKTVPPQAIRVLARDHRKARALFERIMDHSNTVPCEAFEFGDPGAYDGASVIFNMTPLGRNTGDPDPIPSRALNPSVLIYDISYTADGNSALQVDALRSGAPVCDGVTHLLSQAIPTFELLTGQIAPAEVMRDAVVEVIGREPLVW